MSVRLPHSEGNTLSGTPASSTSNMKKVDEVFSPVANMNAEPDSGWASWGNDPSTIRKEEEQVKRPAATHYNPNTTSNDTSMKLKSMNSTHMQNDFSTSASAQAHSHTNTGWTPPLSPQDNERSHTMNGNATSFRPNSHHNPYNYQEQQFFHDQQEQRQRHHQQQQPVTHRPQLPVSLRPPQLRNSVNHHQQNQQQGFQQFNSNSPSMYSSRPVFQYTTQSSSNNHHPPTVKIRTPASTQHANQAPVETHSPLSSASPSTFTVEPHVDFDQAHAPASNAPSSLRSKSSKASGPRVSLKPRPVQKAQEAAPSSVTTHSTDPNYPELNSIQQESEPESNLLSNMPATGGSNSEMSISVPWALGTPWESILSYKSIFKPLSCHLIEVELDLDSGSVKIIPKTDDPAALHKCNIVKELVRITLSPTPSLGSKETLQSSPPALRTDTSTITADPASAAFIVLNAATFINGKATTQTIDLSAERGPSTSGNKAADADASAREEVVSIDTLTQKDKGDRILYHPWVQPCTFVGSKATFELAVPMAGTPSHDLIARFYFYAPARSTFKSALQLKDVHYRMTRDKAAMFFRSNDVHNLLLARKVYLLLLQMFAPDFDVTNTIFEPYDDAAEKKEFSAFLEVTGPVDPTENVSNELIQSVLRIVRKEVLASLQPHEHRVAIDTPVQQQAISSDVEDEANETEVNAMQSQCVEQIAQETTSVGSLTGQSGQVVQPGPAHEQVGDLDMSNRQRNENATHEHRKTDSLPDIQIDLPRKLSLWELWKLPTPANSIVWFIPNLRSTGRFFGLQYQNLRFIETHSAVRGVFIQDVRPARDGKMLCLLACESPSMTSKDRTNLVTAFKYTKALAMVVDAEEMLPVKDELQDDIRQDHSFTLTLTELGAVEKTIKERKSRYASSGATMGALEMLAQVIECFPQPGKHTIGDDTECQHMRLRRSYIVELSTSENSIHWTAPHTPLCRLIRGSGDANLNLIASMSGIAELAFVANEGMFGRDHLGVYLLSSTSPTASPAQADALIAAFRLIIALVKILEFPTSPTLLPTKNRLKNYVHVPTDQLFSSDEHRELMSIRTELFPDVHHCQRTDVTALIRRLAIILNIINCTAKSHVDSQLQLAGSKQCDKPQITDKLSISDQDLESFPRHGSQSSSDSVLHGPVYTLEEIGRFMSGGASWLDMSNMCDDGYLLEHEEGYLFDESDYDWNALSHTRRMEMLGSALWACTSILPTLQLWSQINSDHESVGPSASQIGRRGDYEGEEDHTNVKVDEDQVRHEPTRTNTNGWQLLEAEIAADMVKAPLIERWANQITSVAIDEVDGNNMAPAAGLKNISHTDQAATGALCERGEPLVVPIPSSARSRGFIIGEQQVRLKEISAQTGATVQLARFPGLVPPPNRPLWIFGPDLAKAHAFQRIAQAVRQCAPFWKFPGIHDKLLQSLDETSKEVQIAELSGQGSQPSERWVQDLACFVPKEALEAVQYAIKAGEFVKLGAKLTFDSAMQDHIRINGLTVEETNGALMHLYDIIQQFVPGWLPEEEESAEVIRQHLAQSEKHVPSPAFHRFSAPDNTNAQSSLVFETHYSGDNEPISGGWRSSTSAQIFKRGNDSQNSGHFPDVDQSKGWRVYSAVTSSQV